MNDYLTHTAEEYRQGVKWFKTMLAAHGDKKRSGQAYEHERAVLQMALEALRFAALRMENPPLTREHLKVWHGKPVYLEHRFRGSCCGIVDCADETIVLPDHDGIYRADWFHGLPGRYYRYPSSE